MVRLNKKQEIRKIALQRVEQLFVEAEKNPEMGNRYVALARRIAMKVELPLPSKYKRRFCKFCYAYFRPGNFRSRIKDKVLITYCLKCKKYNKMKF